jgi:hypothetical protein
MPKMSRDSTPTRADFGPAIDHSGDLDDYTVNFVTIRQGHSLTPGHAAADRWGGCQAPSATGWISSATSP